MKSVKTAKASYIITSAALSIAGAFIIINPEISIKAVCLVAGGLLSLCGLVKIIGYFSNDLYSLAFQHDLAFGSLALIAGLFVMTHTKITASVIHFFVGIIVLLDGLIKIQTAIEARKFGLLKWPMIAIAAVVSCIMGLILVIKPFNGAAVVMSFFGFCLFVEGILNIIVGILTIKIFDRDKTIDADYTEKD